MPGTRLVRLARVAGMLGPVLFVATFTIEGWLRPGYDARSMYVSELSIGPRGFIQITSFLVLGTLLLVFARGVAAALDRGRAARAGPILLATIAVSLLLSGPFVTDPATIFSQMSMQGKIHGLFGALVFSLAPVSCLVLQRRFRHDSRWRSLAGWTLAVGLVLVVLVVLMKLAQLPTPLHPWAGLVQRTHLVTYLGWIFAFAYRLRE
jgi:hypothetical membrane protein